VTDFKSLTASEREQIARALRYLPPELRLADVDWSAVVGALRPGRLNLEDAGTVGDLVAELDRGPDYRALLQVRLDAMAERSLGPRWREIIAERERAKSPTQRRAEWAALERFLVQFRNSGEQPK